jgi:CDP-glycerol glycerophosphotransferase (TagB/SpsB family)
MRFKEGILKYETMGFGPVAHEHDQVVETLCEFMRTDCAMPEEYLRRANDFFPFDDRDNCKRIYEAVLAWTDERRKKGSRA